MITPSKIVIAPFMLCVKLLEFLGRRFGLTYKEISVVINLWVQGFLLMISGVFPLIVAISKSYPAVPIIGWSLYAIMYVCGFAWMLWHYRLPFERAFDLCVDDLLALSDKCKISYHAINIILFVGVFLFLILVNLTIVLNL